MYGGSQSTLQPSAEWDGTVSQVDYYFTGEYLQNAEGIENPAPTRNAIHDDSQQPRGFAYVSGIIDPTSRLTAILGTSRSGFQIPQVAGQTPSLGLTVNGVSDFPSALINETQTQINNYGILAWQKRVGDIDFQLAGFSRYSSAYFSPGDPTADILFNGIAQTAYRQSWASGVQGDGSWRASPEHTLRAAFMFSESVHHSVPRLTSCQSTRLVRKQAPSHSRFSARGARPDGSIATISRTSGRSFRRSP